MNGKTRFNYISCVMSYALIPLAYYFLFSVQMRLKKKCHALRNLLITWHVTLKAAGFYLFFYNHAEVKKTLRCFNRDSINSVSKFILHIVLYFNREYLTAIFKQLTIGYSFCDISRDFLVAFIILHITVSVIFEFNCKKAKLQISWRQRFSLQDLYNSVFPPYKMELDI